MEKVVTFNKMCDKCGGSTLHKIYRKHNRLLVVVCVECVKRELTKKCQNTLK